MECLGVKVVTTFHPMGRHTWRNDETLAFQRAPLRRAVRLTRGHFLAFISHHWGLGTDSPTLPTPEGSQRVFNQFHLLTGSSCAQGNRPTLANDLLLLKVRFSLYSGRASRNSRARQWASLEAEEPGERKPGLLSQLLLPDPKVI